MAVCRAPSAVHDVSDHIGDEAVLCIIFQNIYIIYYVYVLTFVYILLELLTSFSFQTSQLDGISLTSSRNNCNIKIIRQTTYLPQP